MRYLTRRDLERFKILADIKYIGKNVIELSYAKKDDVTKALESTLSKDTIGKANGVASLDATGNIPLSQLGNVDNQIFVITDKLPTEPESNKIYIIPSETTGENNIYTEYCYINNVWEKLGEFKAEVNLSEYAKTAEVNKLIEAEKTNRETSIKEVSDKVNEYPGFKFDELRSIISPYKVKELGQEHIIKKYGAEGYSYIVNADLSLSNEDAFNDYVYNSNSNIWNKINKYKVKTLDYGDTIFAYIDGANLDTTHKLYFDYSKTDNPNVEELYLIHDIIALEDNKYFCKIDCEYIEEEDSKFIYDANTKTWYDTNLIASNEFTVFNCENTIDDISNVTIYDGKGKYDYTPQGGSDAIAIGKFASGNENGIAIGNYSDASVESNIAIGNGATTQGDGCIAIGFETQIKDYQSSAVAIGGGVCIDKNSIMKIGHTDCAWIAVNYPDENIFIKGIGGFDGTNLTIDDSLNKDIKPIKDVIDSKADKTSIPTKLSQLTNDSNFITTYTETDPVWTSEKGNYYTKTEIDNKGYLTEHQSLADYAKKTDLGDFVMKATDNNDINLYSGTQGIMSMSLSNITFSSQSGGITIKPNTITLGDSNGFGFSANSSGIIFTVKGVGVHIGTNGSYTLTSPSSSGINPAHTQYTVPVVDGTFYDLTNKADLVDGKLNVEQLPSTITSLDSNYSGYKISPTGIVVMDHRQIACGIYIDDGEALLSLGANTISTNELSKLTTQLDNITAATTADEVVTKFNALLTDLKAKGFMTADSDK